ncbi:MAG: GGDEF domain-containing phosphodiesterase [Eubacterium sp.]|nr:GGDEF domain-containing phosphodiesterase [Eubacterium sp.]
MDEKRREEFYILFEKMADLTMTPGEFDRQSVVDAVSDICKFFHLSKGFTQFYKNRAKEKEGDGEIICDYDDGRADKVIASRRIVTKSKAVVIGTAMVCSDDNYEYTEEEIEKIDLSLRTVMCFIGRNRLQEVVEKLGFYDEDGYPNMRYFLRYLDELQVMGELKNRTAAWINLRHFSLINDEIGRKNGNVVMRRYTEVISQVIDESGVVCRMGGDNFVTIFSTERLGHFLEIMYGIPVAYDDDDKRVMVSSTAGIYTIPEGMVFSDPAAIMGYIYPLNNIAQRDDSDDIIFYDEKMDNMREKSIEVQKNFKSAIKKHEFKVYYQPKVDVNTGKLAGAEALCRWFRDGKMVPPMDFIPFLERNNDICELDFYMLDSVCKDIKRWIKEGKEPVRVSVNLSRKHLVDVDLHEHIMEIIEKNDIPHMYIEIELTETTTDVEFKDLKRVVNDLQAEGICTAVDDFGIGYSSMNLIREIPWNVLKIDKCFLPDDKESAASITSVMFKHVVAMATDMGLECVTEGVETKKQVQVLKKNHCHIAQGYYFDKPLPVDEFEARMTRGEYEV